MKHWYDKQTGCMFCEPSCADEWLWHLWAIGADYDGCHNSMNFLKNIKIDEFFCSHFNIESGRKKATFF